MPLQQSQKKRNSILILSTVTALCFLAIYTLNRPQSINAIATDYFPETADQRLLKWGMTLPEAIEHNLADINEPFAENETLLFFHIPKSGGTTVKQYYGVYMHLETASQNGIQESLSYPPYIRDGGCFSSFEFFVSFVRREDGDRGALVSYPIVFIFLLSFLNCFSAFVDDDDACCPRRKRVRFTLEEMSEMWRRIVLYISTMTPSTQQYQDPT
eukprot:13588839-Ditylum_brightwellii.AAC.1